MNANIIAVLISEGSRLLSQYIQIRPRPMPAELATPEVTISQKIVQESPKPAPKVETATKSVATGCIPCSIGHVGTCSGLLNEAMRFAYKDGVASPEVIDRVGMCLDELNSLERVDMRPEAIADLPTWEKSLAQDVLKTSRDTRHQLESLTSVDQLERTAANVQKVRREVAQRWFREKMATLPPEQQAEIRKKVANKAEATHV